METPYRSRLKVKLGVHEFEAEGEPEAVQLQYREFQQMVANVGMAKSQEVQPRPLVADWGAAPPSNGAVITVLPLERILKVEDRIVSMTGHTRSVPDAVLMIMLGQKNLRANELVTGAELTDGLRTSGHQVSRVDYTMEKLVDDGYVIKIGAHRSTKYRLTNTGVARATELAKELIAVVG